MDIEKVSLSVQIDGEVYFVALTQERLKILVSTASALSDNGKLNVIKAPESYKFQSLEDLTE